MRRRERTKHVFKTAGGWGGSLNTYLLTNLLHTTTNFQGNFAKFPVQPRKNTWPLPLRADRGEVGHRLGLQRVRRRGGPQALSCGRVAQALASLTECPCVCGDRVGTWVGHEWVWAWWFEAGLCIHLGIRVYSRVFNLRAGKVQNTRIHLAILVYSTCRTP